MRNGVPHVCCFLPALSLQFAVISVSSALLDNGISKPTMVAQMLTVVLNALLAPSSPPPSPVGEPDIRWAVGAGLASALSVSAGVIMRCTYFHRVEKYVRFDLSLCAPRVDVWN